jgi:hypothetical protein
MGRNANATLGLVETNPTLTRTPARATLPGMPPLRTIAGLVLCVAATAAMGLALWHLLDTGTCASGGPYVSARPCPDGTTTWILLAPASVIVLLAGMALMGRLIVPWTIFFAGTGGTLVAAALAGDLGPGGSSAAWSVGPMFVLMGVVPGVWALATWLRERGEPEPASGGWLPPVAGGWLGATSPRDRG